MDYAPIALFVYNRPEHTRRTVEALQKNALAKDSELFVFSDNTKNEETKEKVREVREYAKKISGFKSVNIVERDKNYGLANSIISGVTQIVNQRGKIIVLEDDLVCSPFFLEYMNDALNLYKNENEVGSIHGYVYPMKAVLPETFFLKHTSSWGWATWKRAWDLFEPDGSKLLAELEKKGLVSEFNLSDSYDFLGMLERQISGVTNSWAIRWNASLLINGKLNLYPKHSLIQNIGQDGSGTNRGDSHAHDTTLSKAKIFVEKVKIEANIGATEACQDFFMSLRPSLISRLKTKLKNLIGK